MDDIFGQVLADPTVTAIGSAVGAALVALWLAAAWWAYTDATRRTASVPAAMLVAAWIVISTPLFMPLALAAYAFARPQHSAAEHRTRRLAEELVDTLDELAAQCPSCSTTVEEGWLRCPSCSVWLALPCTQCGSWSDRSLTVCPYCGGEERAEAAVQAIEPAADLGRPRRGRRQLRAIGPGRRPKHENAAAGMVPAAAVWSRAQRVDASSARPRSYAASRDASSASS